MRLAARLAAPLLALAVIADPPAAPAAEAEYWHPPVTSTEAAPASAIPVRRFGRDMRAGFVAEVMRQVFERGYGPRIAAFTRGREADELIVVALDDQVFASLQRARAVLEQLAAPSRATTPTLVSNRTADPPTINDVLGALGFSSLILTDGVSWTHRVEFR
jgi:hypothetical protein